MDPLTVLFGVVQQVTSITAHHMEAVAFSTSLDRCQTLLSWKVRPRGTI